MQNKSWKTLSFLGLWFVFLFLGFAKLFVYSNTAGVGAVAPMDWPTASVIQRSDTLSTLLLFVHPHCPCSEATVGELERLMLPLKNKVKGVVVFYPVPTPENSAIHGGDVEGIRPLGRTESYKII